MLALTTDQLGWCAKPNETRRSSWVRRSGYSDVVSGPTADVYLVQLESSNVRPMSSVHCEWRHECVSGSHWVAFSWSVWVTTREGRTLSVHERYYLDEVYDLHLLLGVEATGNELDWGQNSRETVSWPNRQSPSSSVGVLPVNSYINWLAGCHSTLSSNLSPFSWAHEGIYA